MAIKHAQVLDSGYLAAASITANYQTILTLAGDIDILIIQNTLDADCYLSIPNEDTSAPGIVYLIAETSLVLDARANDKRLAAGNIQIKAVSSLPTAGGISITGIA